jgi:hypothetical protein
MHRQHGQSVIVVTGTAIVACFVGAALTVFLVSLLKADINNNNDNNRGAAWDPAARAGPPFFKVVPSPPDGRCLYHSLLSGLRIADVQQTNQSNQRLGDTDALMEKIKEFYVRAVRNENKNLLFHAFRPDFIGEIKKIDALRARRPLGKDGYPDVGAIQLLIHQGEFPYRVNLGIMNREGRMEITRFPVAVTEGAAPATTTIYVKQVGGDNGHFDALVPM